MSSSVRSEEETMLVHKQGIVTILSSDCDRGRACAATSLRRTLSADMSSKKWLSQNALLSRMMKKIASSEDLSHSKATTSHEPSSLSSSEAEEDDYDEMKELEAEEAEQERFQVWSTIQGIEKKPEAQFDIWSSILSKKAKEETLNSLLLTPYVHPLVKRSKSSLSEKSLEICTESLGSETGSDHVFSSNSSSSSSSSSSETEDSEEEQGQEQEQLQEHDEPKHIYHHVAVKKTMPRCFPPPLPAIHMRSHRDGNGRLFLEAVPVASQKNNFCAQRQDGRLVLTFAAGEEEEEEDFKEDDIDSEVAEEEEKDQVGEWEEEFVGFDDDDDEGKEYEEDVNYDEEEEGDEILEVEGGDHGDDAEAVIEQAPLLFSGAASSVHNLALMMNKPTGVVSRNTKWSEKSNQVVNFDDVSVVKHGHVAQSLPPRPGVARLIPSTTPTMAPAAAASLNADEGYWGAKNTAKVAAVAKPLSHQQNKYSSVKNNNSNKLIVSSGDGQKLVVMRGKNGDYLVHNSKSCMDSRRSFLFWEPHCIAT